MAKGRRRGRRRGFRGYRGMGSVITVRPAMRGLRGFRGLGRGGLGRGLGRGLSGMLMGLLAPLLGFGVPVAIILALRTWVNPAAGTTQQKLVKYAPLIGGLGGLTTSLVIGMLGGMVPGSTALAGSIVSAGGFTAYDMIRQRYGARIDSALMASTAAPPPTDTVTQGVRTGVIVPEYRGLPARTGAIVMEKASGLGKPGQVIQLGSINPMAFGTPAF